MAIFVARASLVVDAQVCERARSSFASLDLAWPERLVAEGREEPLWVMTHVHVVRWEQGRSVVAMLVLLLLLIEAPRSVMRFGLMTRSTKSLRRQRRRKVCARHPAYSSLSPLLLCGVSVGLRCRVVGERAAALRCTAAG